MSIAGDGQRTAAERWKGLISNSGMTCYDMIVEAGRTQHGTCGSVLSANNLQVVDAHQISLSDLI